METIPQLDQTVGLQVDIKESVRRHLKSEAARRGMTMGELVTASLAALIGEPNEPESEDSGASS